MGIRRKRRPRTGTAMPPRARQLSLLASLNHATGDYSSLQLNFVELVAFATLVNRDDDHVWD